MIRNRSTMNGKRLYYTVEQRLLSNDVLVSYADGYQTPISGERHTISWDGTKRTGPFKGTRACHHTTCKLNNGGLSFRVKDRVHPTKYYRVGNTFSSISDEELTVPDLASTHIEALQYFESGCQEKEILLVNNLMELGQVKSLFTPFSGKGLKKIANAHLSYEFGWKPLIKDITAIHDVLSNLQKKISWLRKNQGKPVKVTFRKTFNETPVRTSYDFIHLIWEDLVVLKASYTAYATVVYDVSQLRDWELGLKTLLNAFGVTSIIATAWEAIPYSFVVDWFLKVGNFLSQFDKSVTLPMRILDIGWSYKAHERLENAAHAVYPYPFDWKIVGTRDRTLYHREPGLPVTFSSLTAGSPGLRQLALGISLLVQKL